MGQVLSRKNNKTLLSKEESARSLNRARHLPSRYSKASSPEAVPHEAVALLPVAPPPKPTPSPIHSRRFLRDLQQVVQDGELTGIEAWVIDADRDPYHLHATVRGPSGTPYQGGTFELSLQCDKDYPFTSPRINFRTRCFHHLVDPETGRIAMDVLNKDYSPAWTLHALLLAVQSLMDISFAEFYFDTPYPYGVFMNNQAGQLLLDDPLTFQRVAREHTELEAIPNTVERMACVLGLQDEKDKVAEALRKCDGQILKAAMFIVKSDAKMHAEYDPKDQDGSLQLLGAFPEASLKLASMVCIALPLHDGPRK